VNTQTHKSACPFCGSTKLRVVPWSDDTGEYDAIECNECLAAAPCNTWNKRAEIEALADFAQEVRRSGDTRLASMAIAVLARVEKAATAQSERGAGVHNFWYTLAAAREEIAQRNAKQVPPEPDLFHLLSHREALLLAESELAGSYGSVDQWKTTLGDSEREVLESYDLEVQQAFDNITFIATGGLSGTERPRDSPRVLAMISRLPRNEPNHVPDPQEEQ